MSKVLRAPAARTIGRAVAATKAALVTSVALGLALSSARGSEPFDIPVILSLTGSASFLGLSEQRSLVRAETVLSEDGGIDGRPVHFVFYDDQSSPQTAVQLANQVIATKSSVVLGSGVVGMCNAMAPLMARGPVMYCLSPGLYPKSGGFVFSSSNSTADLMAAQVRFFRMRGLAKIALITSTDASGQDAARQFKAIVALPENEEIRLAVETTFNPTDVSVAAQVQRVKSAAPQAIIVWATGAAVGTVFRAIVDAGLDVPVATTDGNMTFAQMAQFKDILPRVLYIPSPEWPESDRPIPPEVASAKAIFFKAFSEAVARPDAAYTFAWDPAALVVSAFKKLGPAATPVQVRDYLANLKGFAGVNGFYDFKQNPQRGLDDSNVVVTQWMQDRSTWQTVSEPRGIPLKQR